MTDALAISSSLLKANMSAFELAQKMRSKVIDPASIKHLYRPMNFTKTQQGNYSIVPTVGTKFPATTIRHALMFGVKLLEIQYPQPVTFHSLKSNKGTLTSDKPVEIYSQYISFQHMHGDVLVGGLGLGMAAEMIRKLPAVDSVTVVEKERDIIRLIGPQLDSEIEVVQSDLFKFLKNSNRKFDSAYYDIWYRTGESGWSEYLVPLYRASRRLGIKTLGAWGDYEMRYQLVEALFMRSQLEERFSQQFRPYWVFQQGLKKRIGHSSPYLEEEANQVVELMKLYLDDVGLGVWELTFPWDAYQSPNRKKGYKL